MIITSENCLVPECKGASHKWEFQRPTVRELQRIETATGLDIEAWMEGINGVIGSGLTGAALDSILALVDVLHRREGVRVPFEDIDVDLGNIDFDFEEGELEDGEGQGGGEAVGGSEGKDDPAPTAPSHLPEAEAPVEASGSGPAPEAESVPRSLPTPQMSGGGSASR